MDYLGRLLRGGDPDPRASRPTLVPNTTYGDLVASALPPGPRIPQPRTEATVTYYPPGLDMPVVEPLPRAMGDSGPREPGMRPGTRGGPRSAPKETERLGPGGWPADPARFAEVVDRQRRSAVEFGVRGGTRSEATRSQPKERPALREPLPPPQEVTYRTGQPLERSLRIVEVPFRPDDPTLSVSAYEEMDRRLGNVRPRPRAPMTPEQRRALFRQEVGRR